MFVSKYIFDGQELQRISSENKLIKVSFISNEIKICWSQRFRLFDRLKIFYYQIQKFKKLQCRVQTIIANFKFNELYYFSPFFMKKTPRKVTVCSLYTVHCTLYTVQCLNLFSTRCKVLSSFCIKLLLSDYRWEEFCRILSLNRN